MIVLRYCGRSPIKCYAAFLAAACFVIGVNQLLNWITSPNTFVPVDKVATPAELSEEFTTELPFDSMFNLETSTAVGHSIFEQMFGSSQSSAINLVEFDGSDTINQKFQHPERSQLAERMKQLIQFKYFARLSEKMRSTKFTDLNFLSYKCNDDQGCGGMGDRIRGTISLFFLALGSQRVFHIDWTRYSKLRDYFEINENLYGVKYDLYHTYLSEARSKSAQRLEFMNIQGEADIVTWGSTEQGIASSLSSLLEVRSNTIAGLEGALRNKKFASRLKEIMPAENMIDSSVFISAFLRTVYGRPVARLTRYFEDNIVKSAGGMNIWRDSFKIGVQIRRGDPRMVSIMDQQLQCFVDRVSQLVESNRAKKPLLFLTVDSDSSFTLMLEALSKLGVPVLDSSQLGYAYSDKSSTNYTWLDELKPYLDWFVLTKMDHLIISRSGFGETASWYSLVPTQRFASWTKGIEKCEFHQYNMMGSYLRSEIYQDDNARV